MEEAQKIWKEICRVVELKEFNSTSLSTLVRKYVDSLPPEWRNRSLAIISPENQCTRTVIPLTELPDVIDKDPVVRQLFIGMVRAYVDFMKQQGR